jgi:predicted RNase H-like nuclease (RuvC/YqgF family)
LNEQKGDLLQIQQNTKISDKEIALGAQVEKLERQNAA